MRYRSAVIAYHPHGEIRVAERTDNLSWTDRYSCVVEPGLMFFGKTRPEQKTLRMLTDFVHAVVLDGVKIDVADSEFRKIDEYRKLMIEDSVKE